MRINVTVCIGSENEFFFFQKSIAYKNCPNVYGCKCPKITENISNEHSAETVSEE